MFLQELLIANSFSLTLVAHQVKKRLAIQPLFFLEPILLNYHLSDFQIVCQ